MHVQFPPAGAAVCTADCAPPKRRTRNCVSVFLCVHYTIDEHTSCRSGSDQLQNQARFCKMFSLPHGSRRRICPKRLLQNRSDTVGRSYSYDILKNCTLERGKQCTICSVVYCKRREYVVLFLIRKMDSIFGGEFEVYSLFYFECVFRWNIKHKIILKTNAQA